MSLFGTWTKKSGYGALAPRTAAVRRLVWLDKRVSGLAKAKKADVYAYVVEAFDDSPDMFVGGPDLAGAKQVTSTNPFQSKYAWGRAEIDRLRARASGDRLQGILHYPAGYEAGKKYPMVVYIYEKLSDGVHHYVEPVRARLLQRQRVHTARLLLLPARHRFRRASPACRWSSA